MPITITADTLAMQADYVARLENRLEIDRIYAFDSAGLKLVAVTTDDAQRRDLLDSDLDGIGARDTTIGMLDAQVELLRGRVRTLNESLRQILAAAQGDEPLSDRLDRILILAATSAPDFKETHKLPSE